MIIRGLLLGTVIAFSTTAPVQAGLEPDKLPEALAPATVAAPEPAVEPAATGVTNAPVVVETQAVVVPAPAEVAPAPADTAADPQRRPFTAVASVGRSDGEVVVGTIALDYHFDWHRTLGEHGVINPYCEFLLGYWEGEEGHTGVTSLHEAGLSLLLRYRYLRQPLSTYQPYIDAGFGLHYLTEERIESKELGRNWQAGSNIGIGLLFPRDERFELGLRLRHLSNAGTDESNWGVNQLLARFGVRF